MLGGWSAEFSPRGRSPGGRWDLDRRGRILAPVQDCPPKAAAVGIVALAGLGPLGDAVISAHLLLVLYLRFSLEFGETNGPLAGIIGILLWAYLGSLALFMGLAFAAQLEGVRQECLIPWRLIRSVPAPRAQRAGTGFASKPCPGGPCPSRPRDRPDHGEPVSGQDILTGE